MMMTQELRVLPAIPLFRREIAHLLWIQLQEHAVQISEELLLQAVDGVFEDGARGALWIAFAGERPVGVAYVSYIWAMEHGGRAAWLEELFVLPEFRDRGFGSKILEVVIRDLRASECVAIDLEVESDHKRVESLYLRNGFKPLARSRWVKALQ